MKIRDRNYWILGGIGLAAWLVVSEVVVPGLISAAYRGEGWGLLARAMGGHDVHPLSFYRDSWLGPARGISIALLVLIPAVFYWFNRADLRRRAFRWLLGGSEELEGWAVVGLAAVWGLLAGGLEASYLGIRQALLENPVGGYRSELLWLAPLTATIAFGVVGGLVALFARVAGTRVSLRKLTIAFGALALYGVMQARGIPLYRIAEVALSLGLATAAGRAVANRPGWSLSVARSRLTPLVVGGAIAITAAVVEVPPVLERQRAMGTPPVDASYPNVLLIMLDTVRAQELGLYGYERPTSPHLDAWARDGVVFDNAYSTAPWTLTSHATLFTGLYPFEVEADFEKALDDEHVTLAEILRDHGYATAGFVANLMYTTESSGLDQGFLWYEDQPRTLRWSWGTSWLARELIEGSGLAPWIAAESKPAPYITDSFLEWLPERRHRPFFAFLNYMDAHNDYVSPASFRRRFGAPLALPNEWPDEINPASVGPWHDAYDAAIAYIDAELGRLFRELADGGHLDDTIVIVASDHGEMFGEHGLFNHANSLYTEVLRVPLIISSWPGSVPGGVRIPDDVTLRDLPATILDLAGVQEPRIPGSSLTRFWSDDRSAPSAVYAELNRYRFTEETSRSALGDMDALVFDGRQVIRNGDGSVEMYDLRRDPGQRDDLSGIPEHGAARDSLIERLDAVAGSN